MVSQLLGVCEALGLTFSPKQIKRLRRWVIKDRKKDYSNNSSCLGLLITQKAEGMEDGGDDDDDDHEQSNIVVPKSM